MSHVTLWRRKGDVVNKSKCVFLKVCAIFIIFCWACLGYWVYWPYQPIEVIEGIEILNENNIIKAGEELDYKYTVNKNMQIGALVTRQLINTYVINYANTYSNIPKGKRIMRHKIPIPDFAHTGEYRLRIEAVYQVNLIRKISVVGWSKPFKIVERYN